MEKESLENLLKDIFEAFPDKKNRVLQFLAGDENNMCQVRSVLRFALVEGEQILNKEIKSARAKRDKWKIAEAEKKISNLRSLQFRVSKI